MASSEVRVCEQCGGQIGRMRGKRTKFCSGVCSDRHKRAAKQGAREKTLARLDAKAKTKDSVLLHTCVFGGGNGLDPFVAKRCKCRKVVTVAQAESLISDGDAVDFVTRMPVFSGGAVLQIGKKIRTPRVATVEAAHCSRLVEKSPKVKQKPKTIEELKAAAERDQLERSEEEALRLQVYGDLNFEFFQSLIVQVPAEQYDQAKVEAFGRPGLFWTSENEQRTAGGIGKDVSFFHADESFESERDDGDPTEDDVETEVEFETEMEVEDSRSAEQVIEDFIGARE